MTGDNENVDDFLARCDDAIDDWVGSTDSASWSGDGSHEYDTGGEYFGIDQMWSSHRPTRRHHSDESWVVSHDPLSSSLSRRGDWPREVDMSSLSPAHLDPLRFVHSDEGREQHRPDGASLSPLRLITHRLSDLVDYRTSRRSLGPFIGFGRTPSGFDDPVYAPDPLDQMALLISRGARHSRAETSWERLMSLATDFSEETDGQLHEDVSEDGALSIWVTTSADDSTRAALAVLERARQYAAEHGGEADFRISFANHFVSRAHVTVAGVLTPAPGSTDPESDADAPPFAGHGGTPGVRQRMIRMVDELFAVTQAAFPSGVPTASDDRASETPAIVDSRTPRPRRSGRQAQESPYGPLSRRRS